MDNQKSFIELQFPVSRLSKESYKERKANLGQTLTGLGKWWGRKPLVMVRAAVLGLLMPASDNPKKDMEIFLKIMTMDKEGLLQRRNKTIPLKDVYDSLTPRERKEYFNAGDKPAWKNGITATEKQAAVEKAWNRFTYDKKLTYCLRPEQLGQIRESSWYEINDHLKTTATNLTELVEQLSVKRFGRRAVVGDCFCGGGSVPFEAARMGCDVFASELNPVAGLLTWAALNIAGADDQTIERLREFQQKVYDAVEKQIFEWGIETNEKGHRANSYLYCVEITCPECGHDLPLAPSWVIGKGTKTIAVLNDNGAGFDIDIKSGVSAEQLKVADKQATVRGNEIYCLHCQKSVRVDFLRRNMRLWEKTDLISRENDVFRDRLYCIRYIDVDGKRYYTSPSEEDLQREKRVIELLSEYFGEWQEKGYIPDSIIEDGAKTHELMRTRGWKYWHQLFNPRQLLTHGLFIKVLNNLSGLQLELVVGILGVNKLCNWNSVLSRWNSAAGVEKVVDVFSNQALNTIFNYGVRGMPDVHNAWFFNINNRLINRSRHVSLRDALKNDITCHLWITDPPYADAVNYHELSEFFLAWDKKLLKKAFPDWYTDSKRVLAVQGRDASFNSSMIDIYRNLAENMPDNGMQVIMFTHQDVNVWADLTLIVWSAGLQVTAAWNIATETDSGGLKDGNYVKGTVLMVLRKQTSEETAFLDEIMPKVEDEVMAQIKYMHRIDDQEEPNFSDADYILAAFAASLKVLTTYRSIEDIDVEYELSKERGGNEQSPIAQVIESAKKIAYDQLIPAEFDSAIWKSPAMTPAEKLYVKGLEMEKNNIYQLSTYQELSRGYGVPEYRKMLQSSKANAARFKTPAEWGNRAVSGEDGFAGTLLRHVFMALYLATKDEDSISAGRSWLKSELTDYWNSRAVICEHLDYISTFAHISNMSHWAKEAAAAPILKELVKNDGV